MIYKRNQVNGHLKYFQKLTTNKKTPKTFFFVFLIKDISQMTFLKFFPCALIVHVKLHFFVNLIEVSYDMDQEATMFFHAWFIACISGDLFIAIEMEEGGGHFVDPTIGV